MKFTYLRNIRNWRPQLIPHTPLTINYMKLPLPIFTGSQTKLRFNTFVGKCGEILKEITKKSFSARLNYLLILTKILFGPFRDFRVRHKERKSVLWELGAMGGSF